MTRCSSYDRDGKQCPNEGTRPVKCVVGGQEAIVRICEACAKAIEDDWRLAARLSITPAPRRPETDRQKPQD